MVPEEHTNTTAALVVIGNEILSGKVTDSNSGFLARELRTAGVSLERISVIVDDIATIATEVAECAGAYDVVFTSGGVGPTHDDVTIEGVAQAFGRPVVEHPGLRLAIEKAVGDTPGSPLLKMAEVPEGAELISSGDAHFPSVKIENVYVLPGIPQIFETKVESLCQRFMTSPYHLRQVLVSVNESSIAGHLNATLAAFPALLLGSYPTIGNDEYRVRLTLESKDERYLDSALEDLVGRIPGDHIVKIER